MKISTIILILVIAGYVFVNSSGNMTPPLMIIFGIFFVGSGLWSMFGEKKKKKND